jgi:hypothetical protein
MRYSITLCAAALAFFSSTAFAQEEHSGFRLNGVLEHYVTSTPSMDRPDLTARWLQVKGEARGLGFTLGTFEKMPFKMMDENYLELERKDSRWRLGRIRSAFGQSEWGDHWYSGFVNAPMMRVTFFSPGFMLSRFDTGLDYRGGSHALEYQIGAVDISSSKSHLLPDQVDHVITRLQTFQAGAVLGLSALFNSHTPGTELFNLDWRWSSPQWIVRGELLRGRIRGQQAHGQFVDVYFHPLKQFRTTLLARLESSGNTPGFGTGSGYVTPGETAPGVPDSRMATLGIKQLITRDITLSATHGWGNQSANLRGATGWAFQATHFLRF